MGNIGSSSASGRRRHNHPSLDGPIATGAAPLPHQPQQRPPPQPEMSGGNQYVFAAASPYPHQYNPSPPPYPNAAHPQYPTPGYYQQYPGYYAPPPPMPTPLPAPFLQHHPQGRPLPLDPHHHHMAWGGGNRYPPPPPGPMPSPPPYIEHQKAVTIRNVVNLKKETLRIEPDGENPGQFLVSFTFDATVPGSITVIFFAKEGFDCNLIPMKENLLPPVTTTFEKELGQKYRQRAGTGIDFSAFEEIEFLKEGEMEVYPLVVKAEATPENDKSNSEYQKAAPNSQITQAVFEKKENGEYHVRVVKQILWVGGIRYELQEIYGIGNSVENDVDGNDPGKECVICLSEPRDTTVLPCRHMCMCSGCAKLLRLQTNRCPICRQPVERLLEIKVNNKPEEQEGEHPDE